MISRRTRSLFLLATLAGAAPGCSDDLPTGDAGGHEHGEPAVAAPQASGDADASIRVPLPPRLEEMDEAIVVLVKRAAVLVERDPTSPLNWQRLGMVYQANLQFELAREVYGRALELDPTSAPCHYYLSLCHSRLGDTTAGIESMQRATVHDPSYIPAWWRLGLLQLEVGNLAEAERAARRSVNRPAGAVVLARVLLQSRERDEAVELLEQLLAAHPGDRHAHMLLGTAYRQLGRTDEARRELMLGRGELPERVDPWLLEMQRFYSGVAAERKRAEALMERGRVEEAIVIFEDLRAKRPNDVGLIGALAIAHRRNGHVDEAIALLLEAIEIQPSYDMAHFHLAAAYRQKDESKPGSDPRLLEHAMKHADTVVALSPTFAAGHGLRADVLMSIGRNDDAIDALGEAIRCDSSDALWPLRSGVLCFEMGEWDAAIPLLESAAELDPSSVQTLLALASAHLKLGQMEEAQSVLQTAARLEPGNGAIEQTLQQIERSRGGSERSPAPESDEG